MARGSQSQQRRRSARRSVRREERGLENAPALTTDDAALVAAAVDVEDGTEAALAAVAAFANEETLATDPAMECADCAHAFSMHPDAGACTAADCSCEAFALAADDEAAAEEAAVAVEPLTLTMRFQTLDGCPLIQDGNEPALREFVAAHLADAEFAPADTPVLFEEPAAPPTGGLKKWTAILCPEGVPTDDGRIFAPGGMGWRDLPITLMAMIRTEAGHDGAEVAGRIDRIWREGGNVMAEGVFDVGEYGQEIARMVADGVLRGVSVDIAVSAMDVMPRDEVLDDTGVWRDGVTRDSVEEGGSPNDLFLGPEDVLFVVWEGKIGAATVCPFPAFADATIALAASLVAGGKSTPPHIWTATHQAGWRVTAVPFESLTASALQAEQTWAEAMAERHAHRASLAAAAVEAVDADPFMDEIVEAIANGVGLTAAAAGLATEAPPSDWFRNPELSELTPLVITADGRVYGHAAAWDTCHIGIPDVCVTAPTTDTDYAYFHLGEVECAEGERIACGKITLDTGHANRHLSRVEAAAHYDHTGTAVADVVAGEDEFGIWVAGALRPGADAEKVRTLRGSVLSGDWRDVNGNLELVALLAVNVPGFPVPRPRAVVASGDHGFRTVALTAAGVHDGKTILTRIEAADSFAEFRALAAQVEPTDDEIAALAQSAAA